MVDPSSSSSDPLNKQNVWSRAIKRRRKRCEELAPEALQGIADTAWGEWKEPPIEKPKNAAEQIEWLLQKHFCIANDSDASPFKRRTSWQAISTLFDKIDNETTLLQKNRRLDSSTEQRETLPVATASERLENSNSQQKPASARDAKSMATTAPLQPRDAAVMAEQTTPCDSSRPVRNATDKQAARAVTTAVPAAAAPSARNDNNKEKKTTTREISRTDPSVMENSLAQSSRASPSESPSIQSQPSIRKDTATKHATSGASVPPTVGQTQTSADSRGPKTSLNSQINGSHHTTPVPTAPQKNTGVPTTARSGPNSSLPKGSEQSTRTSSTLQNSQKHSSSTPQSTTRPLKQTSLNSQTNSSTAGPPKPSGGSSKQRSLNSQNITSTAGQLQPLAAPKQTTSLNSQNNSSTAGLQTKGTPQTASKQKNLNSQYRNSTADQPKTLGAPSEPTKSLNSESKSSTEGQPKTSGDSGPSKQTNSLNSENRSPTADQQKTSSASGPSQQTIFNSTLPKDGPHAADNSDPARIPHDSRLSAGQKHTPGTRPLNGGNTTSSVDPVNQTPSLLKPLAPKAQPKKMPASTNGIALVGPSRPSRRSYNFPADPGKYAELCTRRLQVKVLTITQFPTRDQLKSISDRLCEWDPWWEMEDHLVGLTTPTERAKGMIDNHPTTVADCKFKLRQSCISKIPRDEWGRPCRNETIPRDVWNRGKHPDEWTDPGGYQEGEARLILRMLPLVRDAKEKKKRADCHLWPIGTYLLLNGKPIQLMQRRQQRHNFEEWKGMCHSLDLTTIIADPTKEVHLQMCCLDERQFAFSIAMCRYRSPDVLAQDIKNKYLQMMPKEQCIAKAKGFANQGVMALDCEEDDDLGKFAFSLVCSFSQNLIITPVRGRGCNHWQCFDLDSFLRTSQTPCGVRWRCASCSNFISHLDLQHCQLTLELLEEYKKEASTRRDRIEFRADGKYRLLAEVKRRHAGKKRGTNGQDGASNGVKRPRLAPAEIIEIDL